MERDRLGKSLAASSPNLWQEVSRPDHKRWHSSLGAADWWTDEIDVNKCVCPGTGWILGKEPKLGPWWSAHLSMQPISRPAVLTVLLFFLFFIFQSVIYLNAAAGPCRRQLDKQALPDLLVCPLMSKGVRELSGVSFIGALIPFIRASPSWPHHLPKAPPPNTITLGIRIQHMHFGKDKDIQSLAPGILQSMWEGANPVEIIW